jgi:hypothetical protein
MNRTIEFLRKIANGEVDAVDKPSDDDEQGEEKADSRDVPSEPSDSVGAHEAGQISTDEQKEIPEKGDSDDTGDDLTETPENEAAEIPDERLDAEETSD